MAEFRKRYAGPLAELPGLPEWERELLCARGINTPEKAEKFLHPQLSDLHDPLRMQDMDKTLALIREAIARKDRIMVYGDYDVDGVSAVTILLETLKEAGAVVSFRIPSRHQDGYGLNEKAIREMAELNISLLITVDCGISNVAEVRLAKELGMKVIVTDHHEIPPTLPPADAVMDPLLGDYPFRRLCGAGVALKICQALFGLAGVERRIEIAALATVADIVPLVDENRVIVREGMLRMARTPRPGLRALMENAGVQAPICSDDIAFRLAPRINAAGRLGDASRGVTLLTTGNPEKAKEIAACLEENNRQRQETERRILQEATNLLSDQADLGADRALVLSGEEWNAGLIGLVAGKLCEKYYLPTVVLSRKEGQAVGSCRSIPGVNIFEALSGCADLLIRFGGHEQAAGLTIAEEKIPEFRRRLNQVVRESCEAECFQRVWEYDSELELSQVTLETIEALAELEPTGCGNPAPVFLCRGADLQEARRVGKDQSHLKLTLLEGEALRGGIGFGLGEIADQGWTRVDALFRPSRNEFNGRVNPQLQVQTLRPAR
ncbi:MAG: single-stranded-DNA-specific exonuclease RecJ [Clostridia bacterium]|nr:single-stranded-DNA-specific exonuclease RecJ [Clostridia bacterium]